MHKFYWRNTHGPMARAEGHYPLGKSGSADNILNSEGSSSATSFSSHTGSDDVFTTAATLDRPQQQQRNSNNSMLRRIRRMSGRNRDSRPKSVADMDDLTRNIQNIRITNSRAQEFDSIEHLEAATTQAYNRPQYYNTYAQVRGSKSLYFNNLSSDSKSRTWNHDDARQYRNSRNYHQPNEYCPSAHLQKRLSVSSFRYDDSGEVELPPKNTQQSKQGFKEKVQRSLSCERSRHARQMVKTFKISSDRFQENFTKLSSNINNKLGDTKLSQLNCVSAETDHNTLNDWYKPSKNDTDDDDDDHGFTSLNLNSYSSSQQPITLTTPTNSLGHHQANSSSTLDFKDIRSPSLSVFSCTEPQCDEMDQMRRLSHTMRGKMYSANKKLSMIRSKSMERFSKKQEMIVVTPRIKTDHCCEEPHQEFCGPFLGQAIAKVDFTPNPYDREALRLKRGDVIDVIETNPNGTWRGHCNGRVGNFKFLNVETIPLRRGGHHSGIDSAPAPAIHSVQQLLASLNMEQYLSVFTLNGYDSLGSLYNVDKSTLEYFGIFDTLHQAQLLDEIKCLLAEDDPKERDSGCYESGSESGMSLVSSVHDHGMVSHDHEMMVSEERGRSSRSRSVRARTAHLNNASHLVQGLQ